jgi:hypothetical protein
MLPLSRETPRIFRTRCAARAIIAASAAHTNKMQHNVTACHRKQKKTDLSASSREFASSFWNPGPRPPVCRPKITLDTMKLNDISEFGFVPQKSWADAFRPRIQAHARQMA